MQFEYRECSITPEVSRAGTDLEKGIQLEIKEAHRTIGGLFIYMLVLSYFDVSYLNTTESERGSDGIATATLGCSYLYSGRYVTCLAGSSRASLYSGR